MKFTKLFAAAAVAAVAMGSQSAMAATAADTFTATAELADGLTVECGTNKLDFGKITRPSNYAGGGEVTVTAEATPVISANDTQLTLTGGAGLACTVTGVGAGTLSAAFRLRTHSGSQKMTVAAIHMADMKVCR